MLLVVLLMGACRDTPRKNTNHYVKFSGPTMGTTYNISVNSTISPDLLKKDVDSILKAFNLEVSTYIPESTISQFNQSSDSFYFEKSTHPHFYRNLVESYRLFEQTDGFYDPTVMPLVNYWGFGYEKREDQFAVDSALVDSLVQLVGLGKLNMKEEGDSVLLVKSAEGMKLDFSAIAKGDGVDVVADYFVQKRLNDFMVEIGGEVYAEGKNPSGSEWLLGINRPSPKASKTEIVEKVVLPGRALATSGNYRNFYERGGQIYSHTINPKTGYTERNALLSTSVIAANCLKADALATACMTMGVENVIKYAPNWEKTAVFIIYQEGGDLETWSTKEFKNYLKK